MKIEKLNIDQQKFDINLKFYFFLKYLVKSKLSHEQCINIIRLHGENKSKSLDDLKELFTSVITKDTKADNSRRKYLSDILDEVFNDVEIKLFLFSLKLYTIKDLLLHEAKVKNLLDVSRLENLDPLSLEYDKITTFSPYSTRINGALLSLIFFEKLENKEYNFISSDAEAYIKSLSNLAIELTEHGVEPNQIFMLMFSESINQSIISDSGSNYEDRILSVLTSIGIAESDISKEHDKNDSSTEFDFFFELDNKTYGIGAKRTLRERYKQFIKTAQMTEIDVMIEITLGMDLTEEKVNSIRQHHVYLFVSDEIYNAFDYLQNKEGIYPTSNLTINTLKQLK